MTICMGKALSGTASESNRKRCGSNFNQLGKGLPSAWSAFGGSVACCAAVLIDSGSSKLNPTPDTAVPLGTEMATMLEAVVPTEPLKSTITPALLLEPATPPPISLDEALEDEEDAAAEDAAAAVGAAGATGGGGTGTTGATGATGTTGTTTGATGVAGVEVSTAVVSLEAAGAVAGTVAGAGAGTVATTNKGADAVTLVVFTLVTTGTEIED